MAKKAKKSSVNKSQAIRDYMAEHTGEGPTAVAEALTKSGIKVSAKFVSVVKRKKKPRRRGGAARKAAKRATARRGRDGDAVSISVLMQAKRLAKQMGGVDEAKSALDALAKLVD